MGQEQKEYFLSKADTLKQYSGEKISGRRALNQSKAQALSVRYKRSYGNLVWRTCIWEQSLAFGMRAPLLGRGFGVYPRYRIKEYMLIEPTGVGLDSNVTPCHNHLITLFMKMGILGLFLFAVINIYTFFYGMRYLGTCVNELRKRFLIAALGAFLFWHGVALFFDAIDSPPTSIFLWIITGLIFAVVRIDKNLKKA